MTTLARPSINQLTEWIPVAVGLAVLYIPTVVTMSRTIWPDEDQAHGPIVLAIFLWLLWHSRENWLNTTTPPRAAQGWLGLTFGLLLYVVGRSQDILIFEVGSMVPVLAGTLLILRGWGAVRAVWFALLFVAFLAPLPSFVVDAVTGPLKQSVSKTAETLLYAFGYPIARDGVVLTIGQYQLLVADACSGLHSIFSLSALGLLYIYLIQHKQWWRNALLLAAILPTALVANVVRVIVLVLITYYFGDDAGQGFVHGAAGIVLFMIAVLVLMALDGLVGIASGKKS